MSVTRISQRTLKLEMLVDIECSRTDLVVVRHSARPRSACAFPSCLSRVGGYSTESGTSPTIPWRVGIMRCLMKR